MMNNSTLSDWAKQGMVLTGNNLVKSEKLLDKNPKKIGNLLPGNAKVKNTTKVQADGLVFDSKLEYFMYGLLKGAGIEFEFQKVYLLQERFRYGSEAIRAITSRVDFYLPGRNMIIDTKGYANDVAPLKYKMLKALLVNHFENDYIEVLPKIEMPKNKKECQLLLNRLLFDSSNT